jgi:3-hydroxy-9,10-secoandrosta-1,3,5(10)-triene-9,17-dione monooxygenase reductase component
MSDHAPPFDTAKFRQVVGHFPTGVTVVTSNDDDGPVGLAVASFVSVSLDPPLVAIFAQKTSSSWPRIEAVGTFCVNVLAEDQEEVCRRFAAKGDDKFNGLGWHATGSGDPQLEGVLAWMDCEIHSITDAGDHVCVLGLVNELEVTHEGRPLVFFRGGYGRFTA